jgi:adenosylcobinamide kinase / adenosylcobinamide-phosphate guanylyltransferase
VKVLISGTAGADGWPLPDCGCASCTRLTPGHRRPTMIVLPGSVRLPLTGPLPSGHRITTDADGLTITTPDGDRILYAAPLPTPPPGQYGEQQAGQEALDLVLMDVLDQPERLGDLRRRGLVGERTQVVAVSIDHRVPTEAELARRVALWRVRAVPDGTVIDTREPAPPLPPPPRRTLLLGGTRSGKSAEAELRLAAEPEVLYVATGPSGGDDPEWRRRVDAHRSRRPAHWGTVETTDLAGLLRTATTPMLIDGLGTWVAAVFDECDAWTDEGSTNSTYDKNDGNDGSNKNGGNSGGARDAVTARCDELVAAWRQTRARVVAVSDEVGLGVVPATSSGRMFRDVLGRLNQRLALESEDVTLVVSGRLLSLPI